MTAIRYTVSRNVQANDRDGKPAKIAIAWVIFENGQRMRVAIPEDLIKFAGGSIIEQEVKKAAMMPADTMLLRNDD